MNYFPSILIKYIGQVQTDDRQKVIHEPTMQTAQMGSKIQFGVIKFFLTCRLRLGISLLVDAGLPSDSHLWVDGTTNITGDITNIDQFDPNRGKKKSKIWSGPQAVNQLKDYILSRPTPISLL